MKERNAVLSVAQPVVPFLSATALAEALRARSDDTVADTPPLQVPPLCVVLCLNLTGEPDLCRSASSRTRQIYNLFDDHPHRPLPKEDLPTTLGSQRPSVNATSDIQFFREGVGFEAKKDVQSWLVCCPLSTSSWCLVPTVPYHYLLSYLTSHFSSTVRLARLLDKHMGLRGARCLHPGYS